MKNKAGKLIGFVVGLAVFLILFKLIFMPAISSSNEFAPGTVVIISIVSGLLVVFAGHLLQNYLGKQRY